ncbi:MAG: polysaccharide lyase family 7 protein [Planctomycetota bacterium]
MKLKFALVLALLSLVIHGPASAAEPPARVLNLARWKLTLPVDTDLPGRPDEIVQPALDGFQHPDYFFVNEKGDGVVFRAPCGGITTKGSSYPRCELREMDESGRDEIAWGTDDGQIHTLAARLAVTHVPMKKPHVVCAQIHDAKDDLLMLRVEGTKLLIERAAEEDLVLDRNYRLGTPLELKIEAGGGRVRVWIDGDQKLDWKVARKGCYFKTGCYTQSNVEKGDAADAYGEVVVYRLAVEHKPE